MTFLSPPFAPSHQRAPQTGARRSCSSLAWLLLCLGLLGGCTHQRLMEAGQQQYQQQRYEQAVASYQRALDEKPGDGQTRQQLTLAQRALDGWLADLRQAALQAEQQGEPAKALLLYAKVTQLNRDNDARQRYQALRQSLADAARFTAKLTDQQGLVGSAVPTDLRLISDQPPQADNGFTLKLSLSTPQFQILQSTSERMQEYVTGYETVANPALLEAQHQIHSLQDEINDLQYRRDKLHRQLRDDDHHLANLQQQRQQQQHNLQYAAAGSPLASQLQQQLKDLDHQLEDARHDRRKHQKKLDNKTHQLGDSRADLAATVVDLSVLPAVVQIPVYGKYHYQVEQLIHRLSATLQLDGSTGPDPRPGGDLPTTGRQPPGPPPASNWPQIH